MLKLEVDLKRECCGIKNTMPSYKMQNPRI